MILPLLHDPASTHSASSPPAPAPSGVSLAAFGTGGLRELDELVRDPDARGFVVVQAVAREGVGAGVLDAVSRHVERRARALGRPLVKIDGLPSDDPWHELCARCLVNVPADPPAAAQAIVDRVGPAILVVREDERTCFGRALAAELARLLAPDSASRALLVTLTASSPPSGLPARLIELEAEVSPGDLQIWWDAVAHDPAPRNPAVCAGIERLDTLETWWAAALATPPELCAPPPALAPEASRILARIVLSQRSWLASQVGRLGRSAAVQDLLRAGALELDGQGRLVAGSIALPQAAADADDILAVAAALDAMPDPWAAARAGELYASSGLFDQAEAAALRAVLGAFDQSARADFWHRWESTLALLPEGEALPRLLRSADLALRTGDVERAQGLGATALHKRPESFAALLTLGRANVARGDLPTATCWLDKAMTRAGAEGPGAAGAAAMVEVELSEVRLMEGDLEGARRHAVAAIGAPDAVTRLHARNVLGKLLLAQSAWKEAEDHFAADGCEAALSCDRTAELRARMNRAIALLSGGRLDEARGMLAAVLEEGEAHGEVRAVAYALANLATIAILKRQYLEALRLSERAFDARMRLGDKVTLALHITNLAELKLHLGMVSEAEQTLAFGRKACGPVMPGGRVAHFAYTAALIHLERGRTVEAAAELKVAVAAAGGSGHGERLGECWRLAARVALEDGDTEAARTALDHAARSVESPRERGWVAVLEAARARAAGEPFADAADHALARARACNDPEVLREAYVLLHHAAVLDGDARAARAHLDAAVAMRDQIADALPEDMRRRFLSRRDLVELGRLARLAQAAQAAQAAHDAAAAERRSDPRAPAEPSISLFGAMRGTAILERRAGPRASAEPLPALQRMVGRTPAMVALGVAVQKVGPSDATVLVHGESGTGKELVAEAIHEVSARRAGPIVKVNCAALVETLLLSELFGHEKGSFTGAAARRRGRFEVAEGGTLFLDEIGDISQRTQVALLRVLQDRTFERVGGVTPIHADVRIVCATHRDLGGMVARGEFREDLYYRLRGVVLEVPALRQRVADLPLVASAILDRIASDRGTQPKRLAPAALEGLAQHTWPGNIRELENALRAAALFAEGDEIQLDDLTGNVDGLRGLRAPCQRTHGGDVAPPPGDAREPLPPAIGDAPLSPADVSIAPGDGLWPPATLRAGNGGDGTVAASDVSAMTQPSKIALTSSYDAPCAATEVAYAVIRGGVSLSDLKRDIERDCIARALAETGGNITRAAGLLGMKRPRLSQLVKQYGFSTGAGAGAEADLDVEEVE